MKYALHEVDNESLRSGSLFMHRIDEDGDSEDGENEMLPLQVETSI
jgi:hypothetical protein